MGGNIYELHGCQGEQKWSWEFWFSLEQKCTIIREHQGESFVSFGSSNDIAGRVLFFFVSFVCWKNVSILLTRRFFHSHFWLSLGAGVVRKGWGEIHPTGTGTNQVPRGILKWKQTNLPN